MKKLFQEFKTFIARGNVLDMAVGVIVGSAFTAIVTALSNNILKPVINWLLALVFGSSSLTDIYTYLKKVTDASGAVDLTQSIYIDWGAFINAIINFILIAFVLFLILKVINIVKAKNDDLMKYGKTEAQRAAIKKEMKQKGLNFKDKAAVDAYIAELKAQEDAAKEEEEAKVKAEAEEAKKHSTEGLLEEIKTLLESKLQSK